VNTYQNRFTRAKARVANADVPFEAPGPADRADRLAAVAAMIYLVFNEGYSAMLPYEPATGNFIRIVQRVPVRIRMLTGRSDLERLRPGLSANVTVDLS
jgi:predicted RNA polymerase sigma factor